MGEGRSRVSQMLSWQAKILRLRRKMQAKLCIRRPSCMNPRLPRALLSGVCIHIRICVRIHRRIRAGTCTCICICLCICVYICIYKLCVYVYIYVHTIYIYIYIFLLFIYRKIFVCTCTHICICISADPCRGGAQKLRSCMLTAQHYAAVAVFADSYRPSVASPFLL